MCETRWYPTETECGTLDCGATYRQNRELTCAVCRPPSQTSGSLYTRWGRKTCPTDSQIIYSGIAAGSSHSNSGSGANTLCLTTSPQYGDHNDQNQEGSWLGGIRYQTSGYGLRTFSVVHSHRVPCSVCFLEEKSSNFMQPGNVTCPAGWHREYAGYLMAAHYSHWKSNWACVDENPESLGYTSSGFSYFYPVELICGSIKCNTGRDGSYYRYQEMSCAVCSPDTKRKTGVFTRWGRNSCTATTQLVGSKWLDGSVLNVLCSCITDLRQMLITAITAAEPIFCACQKNLPTEVRLLA